MIVSVELPQNLAAVVSLESARRGLTPSQWLVDRLADHFGLRAPTRAATVQLVDDDSAHDREERA